MKPRICRCWTSGWPIPVPFAIWVCKGGGIARGGWTPAESYQEWSKAYNSPWRRFARWAKQLRKEAQ